MTIWAKHPNGLDAKFENPTVLQKDIIKYYEQIRLMKDTMTDEQLGKFVKALFDSKNQDL